MACIQRDVPAELKNHKQAVALDGKTKLRSIALRCHTAKFVSDPTAHFFAKFARAAECHVA